MGATLSYICQTSAEDHVDSRQGEEEIQGLRLRESITKHLIWGTEAEPKVRVSGERESSEVSCESKW